MTSTETPHHQQSFIPLARDVQKIMKTLSNELYKAWREAIGQRLRDLEFEGGITKQDLCISDSAWRLPNNEVRKALSRLQRDLKEAGYEYEFRFQDVDMVNWVLHYSIELPEREESDEEDANDDIEDPLQSSHDNGRSNWLVETRCLSHENVSDVSEG